jgi:pyruvate dehydrogenase E2 component (dihydrolipoamide acetyltransferase)
VFRNVELLRPKKLSAWRKIAIGTWNSMGDPSVYGTLELEVDPTLAAIQELRKRTGVKITLTHFVGKAVGQALRKYPELNSILRFGNLYPRKNVDIFFQAATDDQGQDLSGMTVRNVDRKTLLEIAQEIETKAKQIRAREDQTFIKTKGLFSRVPGLLSRFFLSANRIL